MFDNIGSKIKNVTVVFTVIGMAVSVIAGIVVMLLEKSFLNFLLGVIVIALGCFISWLTSLGMYGFGQLIENTDKLVAMQNEKEEIKTTPKKVIEGKYRVCPHCGSTTRNNVCDMCGNEITEFLKVKK